MSDSPTRWSDTLRGLAAEVAIAARQEKIAGRVVTLKIRFRGFETRTVAPARRLDETPKCPK